MRKVLVTIEDKAFEFQVYREEGRLFIRNGDQAREVDLHRIDSQRYSLLIDGQSHEIGAVRFNGSYRITRGSYTGECRVEDVEVAKMKKKAGISDADALKKITAPMPGLVVSVSCVAGDDIAKNHPLLVMEAMKMENDIKSPAAGKIKTIHVTGGQSVEKGQLLVELE